MFHKTITHGKEMNELLTKIFAHRGASMYAPENTMASFTLAENQGADGIETDIHLTKDKVPVLFHDLNVKRTTNQIGLIKDFTLNEVKQFDAGTWFSDEFAGERVVTLEEFLQWIKPKALYLNLELKNNKVEYEHMETIVYEMVKYYDLLDRTILSTFNIQSINRMKNLSDIEIALLTAKSKKYKNYAKYAKLIGANAIHMKFSKLYRKHILQAKKECIPIRMYTVNERQQILDCLACQCSAIITDVPDLAFICRKQLNE